MDRITLPTAVQRPRAPATRQTAARPRSVIALARPAVARGIARRLQRLQRGFAASVCRPPGHARPPRPPNASPRPAGRGGELAWRVMHSSIGHVEMQMLHAPRALPAPRGLQRRRAGARPRPIRPQAESDTPHPPLLIPLGRSSRAPGTLPPPRGGQRDATMVRTRTAARASYFRAAVPSAARPQLKADGSEGHARGMIVARARGRIRMPCIITV